MIPGVIPLRLCDEMLMIYSQSAFQRPSHAVMDVFRSKQSQFRSEAASRHDIIDQIYSTPSLSVVQSVIHFGGK